MTDRAHHLRVLEALLFASATPLDEESLAARLGEAAGVKLLARPQLNRDTGRVEIQVLSKISLPVFVVGANAQARPAVDTPTLKDGTLSFSVVNTGAAHFMLKQVSVTGRTANGESFSLNTTGWYVLAGGRRAFHLALAAADCRRTAEISIKAVGDASPAETRIPVPANACGEGKESRFLKTGATAS